MIDKLRNICKQLLNNSQNDEEKKKYELISKILDDNNCFSKISIEDAFNILEDLKIPEEDIEATYISIFSNNINTMLNNKEE